MALGCCTIQVYSMYVVLSVCAYLRKVNLVWIYIESRPAIRPIPSGIALSALNICTEWVFCLKVEFVTSSNLLRWPTHLSRFSVICSIFSRQLGCSKVMFTVSYYVFAYNQDFYVWLTCVCVNYIQDGSVSNLYTCVEPVLKDKTTHMS